MASQFDVPAVHRRQAASVPDDILGKLSAAELRVRCAEMDRLHRAAGTAQAEHARHLTGTAQKIARSIPVVEHIERRRELTHAAGAASRQTELVNGQLVSVAGAYEAARRDLEAEHRYPDGLEAAVDAAILGRPSTPDAAEIVRHHYGR